LRRAAEVAEGEQAYRAARQREFLARLCTHADLDVLAGDEMWR